MKILFALALIAVIGFYYFLLCPKIQDGWECPDIIDEGDDESEIDK